MTGSERAWNVSAYTKLLRHHQTIFVRRGCCIAIHSGNRSIPGDETPNRRRLDHIFRDIQIRFGFVAAWRL